MATKKQQNDEPNGYAEAISELEGLLRELDSNNVDVDVLTTKVARAGFLIDWCTARIDAVEKRVDEIVRGFDHEIAEQVDEGDDEDEDDEEYDEDEDDDYDEDEDDDYDEDDEDDEE
jgi:exodeoxyribonuclease VII small subunit